MRDFVLAAVSDMIFRAKILETARILGRDVGTVVDSEALFSRAREYRPALIILDLADSRFDAIDAIRRLKDDAELATVPLLGFYPHVMTAAKVAALEAGCDRVMPRSAFSRELADLLATGAPGEGRMPR